MYVEVFTGTQNFCVDIPSDTVISRFDVRLDHQRRVWSLLESYNLAYKTQSELHDDIKFITEDIMLAWMTREIFVYRTSLLADYGRPAKVYNRKRRQCLQIEFFRRFVLDYKLARASALL